MWSRFACSQRASASSGVIPSGRWRRRRADWSLTPDWVARIALILRAYSALPSIYCCALFRWRRLRAGASRRRRAGESLVSCCGGSRRGRAGEVGQGCGCLTRLSISQALAISNAAAPVRCVKLMVQRARGSSFCLARANEPQALCFRASDTRTLAIRATAEQAQSRSTLRFATVLHLYRSPDSAEAALTAPLGFKHHRPSNHQITSQRRTSVAAKPHGFKHPV